MSSGSKYQVVNVFLLVYCILLYHALTQVLSSDSWKALDYCVSVAFVILETSLPQKRFLYYLPLGGGGMFSES